MSHADALRHAKYIHERRTELSKEKQVEAVSELAGYGLFSDRAIAAIVGVRPGLVHGITQKTDRTGGAFSPEAIDAVLEVIALRARSEVDIFAVRRAVTEGCSLRMLAKLTGAPESSLKRWDDRARKIEAAA